MPEPSKRVAVHGLKRAEQEYGHYVRKRLEAERSTGSLATRMRELDKQIDEILRAEGGQQRG